jgi:hypothetical protein
MFEVLEDFVGKKAPSEKFPDGEETTFKKGAKVKETDLHPETFACVLGVEALKPLDKAAPPA